MEQVPLALLPSSMPESFCMEDLSLTYIRAIAAKARVNMTNAQRDLGVDIYLSKVLEINGRYRDMPGQPLRCQVKSSKRWEWRGDLLVYDLDAKNYNDLVNSGFGILILLCLPPNGEDWLLQDEEELRLRKCAYYWYPPNRVETLNTRTVRIFIPREQIFITDALIMLLDRAQMEAWL